MGCVVKRIEVQYLAGKRAHNPAEMLQPRDGRDCLAWVTRGSGAEEGELNLPATAQARAPTSSTEFLIECMDEVERSSARNMIRELLKATAKTHSRPGIGPGVVARSALGNNNSARSFFGQRSLHSAPSAYSPPFQLFTKTWQTGTSCLQNTRARATGAAVDEAVAPASVAPVELAPVVVAAAAGVIPTRLSAWLRIEA